MLNIALIGAGRIGRIHAANLANEPRLRLSHVVDAMPDAAADVAAATGATVATLETVLADPDIAGVVIASATDTHLDYSVRAITAAKPCSAKSRSKWISPACARPPPRWAHPARGCCSADRKRGGKGKGVSGRVDLGGRRV